MAFRGNTNAITDLVALANSLRLSDRSSLRSATSGNDVQLKFYHDKEEICIPCGDKDFVTPYCLAMLTNQDATISQQIGCYIYAVNSVYSGIEEMFVEKQDDLGFTFVKKEIDVSNNGTWQETGINGYDLDAWKNMNRRHQWVGCGLLVLLMTLRDGDFGECYSYSNWMNQKVKVFMEALGYRQSNAWRGQFSFPHVNVSHLISTMLATRHALRRKIFNLVRSAATLTNDIGRLSKEVICFLRYTEMRHIQLIDRYLMRDYSAILCLPQLKYYIRNLQAMYDKMATYKKEDIPFIKLLTEENDCLELHPDNVSFPLAVARAFEDVNVINTFEHSTIKLIEEALKLKRALDSDARLMDQREVVKTHLCLE